MLEDILLKTRANYAEIMTTDTFLLLKNHF